MPNCPRISGQLCFHCLYLEKRGGDRTVQKLAILKKRLSGYFKWNSLWILIAIATAAIAVTAVLLITSVMNQRFNHSIDKTTQQNNVQIIENVADNIDSYIQEMTSIADTVTELLSSLSFERSFQHYHFFLRDDIDTIAVFDHTGNLVLKTDHRLLKPNVDIKNQDWFCSVAPGSRQYKLSAPHVQRLYKGEYRWVLSLCKGVTWKDSSGNINRGIVLVDLNFNNIKELCSKNLGENGYLYILGAEKQLIYHPRQQMIYAGITQKDFFFPYELPDGSTILNKYGERLSVSVQTLENADWRIIGISPLNGLFAFDAEFKRFIAMVVVCIVFIVLLLAVLVSLLITRPMRRLMRLMGKVEEGELNTFSEVKGVYEVNELSRSFNQMVYQIKRLMEQVLSEQEQLRKSEMKTLHAQINPHFLYNTLDSIVWMAESGDQQSVVKMIEALARFFRLSLSGGKDTISVAEELSHAENYLIIQKIRYCDQFDYTIHCSEDVKNCKTLKITLQPIVENAILHGVANLPYAGHLQISAYRNNNCLIFQVEDNGLGMKPEVVDHILEAKPKSKTGIGIQNVNQRIQLMFGKEYGLQYQSELDEGTVVKIRLPIITT